MGGVQPADLDAYELIAYAARPEEANAVEPLSVVEASAAEPQVAEQVAEVEGATGTTEASAVEVSAEMAVQGQENVGETVPSQTQTERRGERQARTRRGRRASQAAEVETEAV